MRNLKGILSKMADATMRHIKDEGFGDSSEDEEIEYRRLKATHEAAGYREGMTEGEERFLQEGFNRGFIHSSRVNSCWSQLRGVLCALMLYLQSGKSSTEAEQTDGLSLQLNHLLTELETRQRQEVKENLAVEETTQACYVRGVGEEAAQGCCVGHGGGEIAQGCCVGQGGGEMAQGCCVGYGGGDCKGNTVNESTTSKSLRDQSRKEKQQANFIKNDVESDEDHRQPHDCAGRCCGKGHLTTYSLSPTLTELWTRCSNIARHLGVGVEELEEIRKFAGTIVC